MDRFTLHPDDKPIGCVYVHVNLTDLRGGWRQSLRLTVNVINVIVTERDGWSVNHGNITTEFLCRWQIPCLI